ncbi:DUF1741-domain-containing protein [Aureobasidium pullulans]|nr:DUF1741-domain-containing protein [Aureobasidium pullulans]
MSLRISIYALRLTIVVGRVVLWFTFTSGAVDVHISPDYVWLFAFAFMITLHTMFDAAYVAACTANFGADARFDDAFHVFITLLDMQMARAIRLTVAGDHDEARATQYAHITLFTIQNMVEDLEIAKKLCETTVPLRLSRQRPPQLPVIATDRTLAANIIDMMIDCINHNLRKKLDVELYMLNVGILLRLVTFLSKARIRLTYHWSELWRSLLSFVRFLTVYADDLKPLYRINTLIHTLVNLITLSLTQGESFLPDSSSYDDISYKLVEFFLKAI